MNITDEIIMEGLKCCKAGIEIPCRKCPFVEYGRSCQKRLIQSAYDMILRLQGQNNVEVKK